MTKRFLAGLVISSLWGLAGLCSASVMEFDTSKVPGGAATCNEKLEDLWSVNTRSFSSCLQSKFRQGTDLIGIVCCSVLSQSAGYETVSWNAAVTGNGNTFRQSSSLVTSGGSARWDHYDIIFGGLTDAICNLPIGSYKFVISQASSGGSRLSKTVPFTIVGSGITLPKAMGCASAVNKGMLSVSTTPSRPWCGSPYGAMSGSVGSGQSSTMTVKANTPVRVKYTVSLAANTSGDSLKALARSAAGLMELDSVRSTGKKSRSVCLGIAGQPKSLNFRFVRGGSALTFDALNAGLVSSLSCKPLYRVKFNCKGGQPIDPVWVIEGVRYNYLDRELGQKFPESGPTPPKVSGKTYKFEGWYLGSTKVTGSSIVAKGRGSHTQRQFS